MDGHECSEVLLSELDFSNRLDAEYYKKQHLHYKNKIESLPHYELKEHSDFLIGPFGSAYDTNNYVDEPDYRYVRGQDVKPFELQETSARYMAKEDFERLKKYALIPGDILVSVVGTIGNSCIVREKDVPGIFSCKSTVIRVKEYINPYFLTAYLNCKYGYSLLSRQERGALQKGLNLDDLKVILVPDFTKTFQMKFEELLKKVEMLQDLSKRTYESAEGLLEKEIGIDMSSISSGGVSVKSFAESFGSSGRLDAEYYQSGHYELIKQMTTTSTIGSMCNIYDKTYTPADNLEYKYIELANIGESGEIENVDTILGADLPTRARRIVRKGHIIVSSIEGSLSSCAMITDEYDGALCSTGFYVIDSDNMNSETLLVLIKSKAIQRFLKRGCSGTILTNINKNEFLDIPIPNVSSAIQDLIRESVKKTYNLRNRSKELLECAKTAVEMAIEKDEATAIAWLDSRITELTKED